MGMAGGGRAAGRTPSDFLSVDRPGRFDVSPEADDN
jgi:hypothetical protein